jgi:alkaline phosphatase D
MLSEEQWQWLELELKLVSDLKIITNGIQILPPTNLQRPLGRYCSYGDGVLFNEAIESLGETGLSGTQYESWAEIPTQREKLLRMVQESINQGFSKNIVLVSGDQHWGETSAKDCT